MNAIAIPEPECEFTEGELVFLFNLREMAFNGEIVAVLRPDGQIGWMPGPAIESEVKLCPLCQGTGFLNPAAAALVTPDFRLTNLCPDCAGRGLMTCEGE